jgi:hypothetical protein
MAGASDPGYWWDPPTSDEDEEVSQIPGDFQVYVTSYHATREDRRADLFAVATESIDPILKFGRRFVGNEQQGNMSLSAPTVIIVYHVRLNAVRQMFAAMPRFIGPLLVVSVKVFEDEFDVPDFEQLKMELPELLNGAEFVTVWTNLIGLSAWEKGDYRPSFLRPSPWDMVWRRNADANQKIRNWVRRIPPTNEASENLPDDRDEVSVGPFQVYLHPADLSYTRDSLLRQPMRTKVLNLLDSLVQKGELFEGKNELPLLNREAPTIFVFEGDINDDDLFAAFEAFAEFQGPLLFVQINPRSQKDRIDAENWKLYYDFPYMEKATLKVVASPLIFRDEGVYLMNLQNNSDIRKWIIEHAPLMVKSARKRGGEPLTDAGEPPEKRVRAALRAFRGNVELAAAALARGIF